MSISKKKQFDKVIKLAEYDNYYEFYLPLLFFFYSSPNLYLPLIGLNFIELHLVLRIIKLENSNNFIDIIIDKNTILLDNLEKEKFGSLAHEYLVEKYNYYHHNHHTRPYWHTHIIIHVLYLLLLYTVYSTVSSYAKKEKKIQRVSYFFKNIISMNFVY